MDRTGGGRLGQRKRTGFKAIRRTLGVGGLLGAIGSPERSTADRSSSPMRRWLAPRAVLYDRLLSPHSCWGLWQRPECVASQGSW
jgi:hypothetical protein